MILFFLRCILFISLFLIYSCNNDGSVIYNAEDIETSIVTDEDGFGCSPSSICYSLDDVFYDFDSGPLYQGFYKFDKAWSEGGFHNPVSDTLGLYTFNDSYLMAVPSDFIDSDDNENTVIISDNGSFIFEQLDGLDGLPSELVDLVSQPPIPRLRDSLLLVSSNAISNISNVIWSENQLRYIPNTTNSETYSKSFYLTQEYDSIIQNTLIDTGNTPIIDDIILLDYNEVVKRSVTLFDSLSSGDPVKSKRSITFKVKNTFVSPDGPYWRESTDCNDNYQIDEEEVVLLDGYVNSYGVNPKSFEAWCYEGACSGDGGWINEKDCCINNPIGYGCTDGNAIDDSVLLDSNHPEQDCCVNNGGSWSEIPSCQDSDDNSLLNWDMSLEGCTDNTSETIIDLGEDWDHDNTPYSIAFCQGYELAFITDSICIENNGNWISSQGTQDIEQTGQVGEPSIDDVAVSCSNGGNSLSSNYLDCDNSIANSSETIWNYGLDWNNDSSTNDYFTDDFTEAYCLIQNQSACESDYVNLIWTDTGLGDGGICSENNLLEENCQSYCSDNFYNDEASCTNAFEFWYDFNWVDSDGTPNIPQIGSQGEPVSDDVAVGCTNGGNSFSGFYIDCDNSAPNSSETVFDYGNNWNHDGIDFIDAYCSSFDENNCYSFCYNSSLDSVTDDDQSSCSLDNDLVWYNLEWQDASGTENIVQTGEVGEPAIDDTAVGCSNGGVSVLGDYTDCDNSTNNWIYSSGDCSGTNYEWKWIDSIWDSSTSTCINSSESWDNSFSFSVDSADLCLTQCLKGNDVYTMNDFCWNYYDGNESYKYNGEFASGYDRLSGHCYVDDSELIPHINIDSGDEYYLTFCDTGNNLFDPPEFFNDSNEDGVYTTGANFQEAYEDRNCNELLDGEGFNLNFSDLRLNADGYIGDELFICTESYRLSGSGDKLFCDRGNGMWDPPESYYCSPDEGINCDYSGNANTLFNRSDAPEVFLVNYDDWNLYYNAYNHYDATVDFLDNSNELRKPLLTVNPSTDFHDTGLDGCFDELEDGNGGCLCEFKTDYGNNDSLIGCEQLMYQWYSDDLPNLWKKWHQIPKDNNGNYLSATVIITEFDVGLSDISPFNYGECSNGFSGSYKDCCDYYSCNWDGNDCNWDSADCTESTLYCQNNIFQECDNDLDCGGIQGSCNSSKWTENIDPNDDNYWSHNSCYYDGSCEVDNNPPEKISSKTQFDDRWNYETDDGTLTGNIILNEKTDVFSNSNNDIISSEQYYTSPGLYTGYSPYVSLADFVITKEHLYSNLQNTGKDTLFVIDEQMKSIQVLASDPIVESRNTIKSRKVIDQAGLSNGSDQSSDFCEVANNFCSSTLPVYEACLDSNSNLCEVSPLLISESTSLCEEASNELDCESIGCQWGSSIDECSGASSDNSCFYEFDSNKNNVCDAVENSCYNGQFETCLNDLVSQLELTFYQDLLSNFYIMKTEYGFDDYDYLLFNKSSNEYVVKMAHPYYHYQSNNSIPTDVDDFVCEGCTDFWENTLLKPDTLLYSYNGNIIDGQIFVSSENINTENGLYIVDKTYNVNSGVAELEYPIYNPSLYNPECSNYGNEGVCCGIEDECGSLNNCTWVTPPEYDLGAFDPYCDNKSSRVISDCLIVTRVVETTTDGPGQGFRLRTKTYLKPDYKIVKETLEISWDTDPWLDEDTNWSFVSGMEYRNSSSAMQVSVTPDNFLVDYETLNVNDFENMEDFNFSPFKLNKTMGIMRYE